MNTLSDEQLANLTTALGGLNGAPEQMTLGQRLAEVGQAQMPRPLPTNQMAGRVVAPVNPLQAAGNALQGYAAMSKIGQGLQQQQQAAAAEAKGRSAVQAMLAQMLRGQQSNPLDQVADQARGDMTAGTTESPYFSYGMNPEEWVASHQSPAQLRGEGDLSPGAPMDGENRAPSVNFGAILNRDPFGSDDDQDPYALYAALLGQ